MSPFKYFPFQVLSCGAIYCAVNAILKIDCSNENCASVFVTLLLLPFLKKKLLALIQSSFSRNIPANSLGATAMTWRRQQRATAWRSAPKRKATIIMKSQRFRQSSARNRVPGNVLLISYRSKSLYLRLYICPTQIEGQTCPLDALHTSSKCLTSWYKQNCLFFQTTLKYRHLVGLAHHLFSCVYS